MGINETHNLRSIIYKKSKKVQFLSHLLHAYHLIRVRNTVRLSSRALNGTHTAIIKDINDYI